MPFFGVLLFLFISAVVLLTVLVGIWRYWRKGNPVVLAAGICLTLLWGGCLWSGSRPTLLGIFTVDGARIEIRSAPGWDGDLLTATVILGDGRRMHSELGFAPSQSGVIEAYHSVAQNALWLVISDAERKSQEVFKVSLGGGESRWIARARSPEEVPLPIDSKLIWSSDSISPNAR